MSRLVLRGRSLARRRIYRLCFAGRGGRIACQRYSSGCAPVLSTGEVVQRLVARNRERGGGGCAITRAGAIIALCIAGSPAAGRRQWMWT